MEKIFLNPLQICFVYSNINKINPFYEYRESGRFLFFWKIKEGFYYTFTLDGDKLYSIEEIEKNETLFCKYKNVFFKPHLIFVMSNGNKFTYYFKTEDELLKFMEKDELKGINWIRVE